MSVTSVFWHAYLSDRSSRRGCIGHVNIRDVVGGYQPVRGKGFVVVWGCTIAVCWRSCHPCSHACSGRQAAILTIELSKVRVSASVILVSSSTTTFKTKVARVGSLNANGDSHTRPRLLFLSSLQSNCSRPPNPDRSPQHVIRCSQCPAPHLRHSLRCQSK